MLRYQSLFGLLACASIALLSPAPQTQAAANSEAYLGEPFGVGRVTLDVLRGEPLLPLSDERFTVLEANHRVIYPTLKQEPVRRVLRGLLERESPRKVTLYFLFQGEKPFDLSAFTPNEQGVRVQPQHNAARHQTLLQEWWKQRTKRYQTLSKNRDYPPVAENFLIASLSRRLNLPMPKPRSGLLGSKQEKEQDNALGLLFGGETRQLSIDRAMLLDQPRQDQPSQQLELQPLPEAVRWPDFANNENALAEIEVEPLANVVPAECFYVRFGTFSNYWWFRSLQKKWQGDLGNMIARRGIKHLTAERIQQQLSLRESALTQILGPQVISDAAIIGLDPYAAQGGAIGILLQAKNNLLLSADLMRQRRDSLPKFPEAKETTIELAGQKVSLIATPDGKVRSYYAQHEDFHLVTTSQTLAERFLQAAQGDRSLAALPSFRHARKQFPTDRDDTLFAFVSDQFWQNLCTPKYFIENLRRQRSTREPLLRELARYTAQAEAIPAQTADELIAADLLPQHFATRVDGSSLLETEAGPVDSLRGAPGYFSPIADMPITEISSQEATNYQQFITKLQNSPGLLPPIAVAVQRKQQEGTPNETISLEVAAQGPMRQRLGKLASYLGQPAANRMQHVEGDLLAFDAVVEFPAPLANGDNTEHHLFGALRDFRSPLTIKQGTIQPNAPLPEMIRGYLGAWPKPGILSWVTNSQEAPGPEPEQIDAQIWQAKQKDFLLLAFKPEVIRQVLPQLAIQPAQRPAQAWLRLEDLTGTQMAQNVTALGYMRTRQTSVAGSRMMNALANQLKVPRNECREVAQRLVDGQFVCPLGGNYQLYATDRGLEVWISSALPKSNQFSLSEVPKDFQLPLLDWFRGLQADLTLNDQSLNVHLEIKMTQDALP